MRNKALWVLCSAITLLPSLGWAAEGNLAGLNVGELAIVQSQTILFKAKAERAKAEQSILDEVTLPSTANPFQPLSATLRGTNSQSDLPVVKAVFGSGKRLRATLLYSSGFEIDAGSTSQELPGGYRVVTLTVDNVVVERDGKRFPLGFSHRSPTHSSDVNRPTSGSTQALPILPGLIPGQR